MTGLRPGERVVIVGAGHAGVQVADSLRQGGYGADITIIGEETPLPYQRPPLSKDYLTTASAPRPLPLRAERFFDERRIDFRRGSRVSAIDRTAHVVKLDDGGTLTYSTLVLATGAANREPGIAGGELSGIHGLRTLDDAQRLRAALDRARSVVVVGAGFIGLEFAAAARERGTAVTILEATDRPLARAVSPVMSGYLTEAHRRAGTEIRLSEGIDHFTGRAGAVTHAVGTTGTAYPADFVLLGVGVRPRTELAEAAGLAVEDGVVVDERLRTEDPAIYAVGDCASFPSGRTGARRRLESVQNAIDQARHVAKILLGERSAYRALPWFWSNQGSMRLQIAGLGTAEDTVVVSGEAAADSFSVLRFRDDRLIAVEAMNRTSDYLAARRLLATRRSPNPGQAGDPAFTLTEFAATA